MTLYTTHCPKCRALEAALKKKNATYDSCDDISKMQELGFMSAPILEVDGKFLKYNEAMKYAMEEL